MSIGDDRLMPSDLDDAMTATSLTHLTAVSGSHIVIILATLNLLLPARKPLRVGATILVLATIVVLVGPEASVLRSVCVASVASMGLVLGREGQAIAALCAVVTATLLIDPWASRSYGFALSELVCVPALAELFTAPLIVSLSGTVPVWGIGANVAAEPAVPVATLAGLSGALLAPISPPMSSACARVASWATGWIAGAARFFAGMPGAGLRVPGGGATLLSIYGCAGLGWVAWRAWKRWVLPRTDEARDP